MYDAHLVRHPQPRPLGRPARQHPKHLGAVSAVLGGHTHHPQPEPGVQCNTVQYSTVQYSTVQNSTVQYCPSPVRMVGVLQLEKQLENNVMT